jgi:hypothetical protein
MADIVEVPYRNDVRRGIIECNQILGFCAGTAEISVTLDFGF